MNLYKIVVETKSRHHVTIRDKFLIEADTKQGAIDMIICDTYPVLVSARKMPADKRGN